MPHPHRRRDRRLVAALALVLVVAAGLAVHRMLPESAISDIAGDVLYAVAAYVGLVMLFPRAQSWLLAAIAVAWCVAIEFFQLTGVPAQIGDAFPPAMLLLGTVFDARDVVVYPLAILGAALIDRAVAAALHARAGRETGGRADPPVAESEPGDATNNTHDLGADRTP